MSTDNPARPSADAMTAEEIQNATQENQDRNRPDQDSVARDGHRSVANDSSTPGYGTTSNGGSEPRTNGLDNQDDSLDDLSK
jgi:hypothetical protein